MNKIKNILDAEKLIKKGNISAATGQYIEFIRQNPSDVTAINALGDLYIRTGKIEEAVQEFLTVADIYDSKSAASLAMAMLKKVLKWSPQNEEATQKLADLYAQQAKIREACELLIDAALHYEKIGKRQTALEFYEKTEKLNPSDSRTQLKIGEIYADIGKNWQAVDAFRKAAEIFEAENKGKEALGANIQTLYIYPENLKALKSVTRLYLKENQADLAINWLRKGLEKSPDNAEIQILLIRAYLSCKKIDDAEQILYAITKDYSERNHYAVKVGEKLLEKGEINRAVECGKLLLQNLTEKSETDDALALFQKVLEIEKNHLGAMKALAEIFRTLGDEYNLTMMLTSLFDAAVEREENSEAEMALEELVNLQSKAIENSVDGTKIETREAKEQITEVYTRKSVIEIDTLEVFNHLTIIEDSGEHETGAVVVQHPRGFDRHTALSFNHRGEARPPTPPLLESHLQHEQSFQLIENPLADNRTGSSLIQEPGLLPLELHKTYGKVIESIEQLQLNRRFDLNEERQLKTSKAYFHLMEAFSSFLFQAFDLDRGASRNLESFPDLSSALPQEIFRMIEMSKGESVSIKNELVNTIGNKSQPDMFFRQQEQRRAERINLSLPMRVYSKDNGWREQTESLDVSPLGVKFSLTHNVEPGMRLQLHMPMPENLRLYKAKKEVYEVEAYVCRIIFANDGKLLVGAEFGAIL